MTGTVKFHRVVRTTPAKLYKALIDPDAIVKWLPPHGFTGKIDRIEPKVGGSYHMSFTNFSTGSSHSFSGTYLELEPGNKIVYSNKFDDANLAGEMRTTIHLREVLVGTEIQITQEGIPSLIPTEACYLGWQESLALLIQLVEPDIPDQ